MTLDELRETVRILELELEAAGNGNAELEQDLETARGELREAELAAFDDWNRRVGGNVEPNL